MHIVWRWGVLVRISLPKTNQVDILTGYRTSHLSRSTEARVFAPTATGTESNGSSRTEIGTPIISNVSPSHVPSLSQRSNQAWLSSWFVIYLVEAHLHATELMGPSWEMRNAAFGDQKGETTHDLRDVENSAAELNWSQLARAPNGREMTEIEGRSSHRNTDKIVHRRGSNIHTYIARLEWWWICLKYNQYESL